MREIESFRVELHNISKSFGGIAALDQVTLKVRAGEIHALVGENGAGKSTLMKILSGAYLKDGGRILIDGREVKIRNTKDSQELGIGIIYQELSLIPALSVAENVYFNQSIRKSKWIRQRELNQRAASLIRSLGFDIVPACKLCKLSVAQRQIVEIAKALNEKVRILILDEPSAILGMHEIKRLFDTLERLRKEGVAIIYITHHLDEVFQIADRITVLKDGKSSDPQIVSETGRDSVIQMMLGRSLDAMYPQHKRALGEEMIRVAGISRAGFSEAVSFSVRKGEILGMAGLVGSGRTETARAIIAADRTGDGKVYLSGRHLVLRSVSDTVKAGIGMIPEDRQRQGIILSSSVMKNISLGALASISGPFGFIKKKRERQIALQLIHQLSIKTRDEHAPVYTLSGGNQQKVVLAKWLNRKCRVLVIDEPTRGVDIGAKVEIYQMIHRLAQQGTALVVISSETTELMGICDRILVMRKGFIAGELSKKDFSEEELLRMAIGA